MAYLLFFALSGGAIWDLRTGRIPNRWILGFMAAGAVCLWLAPPWIRGPAPPEGRVLSFLVLMFITAVLFFPLFLFRMMGAGDIKTAALICGYLGLSDGVLVIFYGFLSAAAWSLLYMLHRKIFLKRIHYFLSYMKTVLCAGLILPYYQADRDGREASLALAPFFWLGFSLWLLGQAGGVR